jgi:magnesium-protoporphyrin O-methyltransferase
MDSLIHYAPRDIAGALARLAANVEHRIAFTIAPRTPLLTAMHLAGKAFPRSDRSPAIRPVSAGAIARLVAAEPDLAGWTAHGGLRVSSGFYISQAMEITR